ncbi:hypothetical protein RclHR1_11890002 [Rhizophagus clarus]|uniref:Uncharacterized protein n=1 Tax=Rhizophagus clarus TaxID=94130 RepID=A0A2Z6QHS8_9GLOM|nr:hypothetical protein RclHR1_11890002 [Rhizophagus clarus]GES79006.1 hypothetical protein GLOIN_2v1704864 [Rhizophagus clarus]
MVFFFCCRTRRTRKSMGLDNQNQSSITREIQSSTYNTNDTETEHFDEKTYNNDQDTTNKKQEQTNQFKFDRPVTVSDVLEGKITLPIPASKKPTEREIVNPQNLSNNNDDANKVLNGKRELQRLSTTDSMQEFLEIPENIPSHNVKRDEEENKEQPDDS